MENNEIQKCEVCGLEGPEDEMYCKGDSDKWLCDKHNSTHKVCDMCGNTIMSCEAVADFDVEAYERGEFIDIGESTGYFCKKCAATDDGKERLSQHWPACDICYEPGDPEQMISAYDSMSHHTYFIHNACADFDEGLAWLRAWRLK